MKIIHRVLAVLFWLALSFLAAALLLFRFAPERLGWIAFALFWCAWLGFAVVYFVILFMRKVTGPENVMCLVLAILYWVIRAIWSGLYS